MGNSEYCKQHKEIMKWVIVNILRVKKYRQACSLKKTHAHILKTGSKITIRKLTFPITRIKEIWVF